MTGSEQTVPAHAAVMTLGFPSSSAHVTNTAGTGYNIFEGFQYCLAITNSFEQSNLTREMKN